MDTPRRKIEMAEVEASASQAAPAFLETRQRQTLAYMPELPRPRRFISVDWTEVSLSIRGLPGFVSRSEQTGSKKQKKNSRRRWKTNNDDDDDDDR